MEDNLINELRQIKENNNGVDLLIAIEHFFQRNQLSNQSFVHLVELLNDHY